jgi:hypothetical protein
VDLARIREGVPVTLALKSALPVSVDYRFESASGVLASGVLTFAPGETLAWATAPNVNVQDYDMIRLSLSNPISASLGIPSTVYFIETAPAAAPETTTLLGKGSLWKYLDTGVDGGTAWRASGFDDSAWLSGHAELGYGDGDEATMVRSNRMDGSRIITTYFRQTFNVASPASFTNLSMWLLRDDGGVVYLNGSEAYRSPSMPQAPTPINYLTQATNQSTTTAPPDNTVDTANLSPSLLVPGPNLAAVEIHQFNNTSSDISFNLELLGAGAPPPPPPQRVHWATFDGRLTVAWDDQRFVLEQASEVAGPWGGAVTRSPLLIDPSEPKRFFRLKQL